MPKWECRELHNADGRAWYILMDGTVISPPFDTEREALDWDKTLNDVADWGDDSSKWRATRC